MKSADDTERKHEPNGCRGGDHFGGGGHRASGHIGVCCACCSLLNEGAEGMAEALADTILQIMSLPKLGHLLEFAALLCIVRRFVADGTGILEVGRAGLVVWDSLGCKRGGGRGRMLEN